MSALFLYMSKAEPGGYANVLYLFVTATNTARKFALSKMFGYSTQLEKKRWKKEDIDQENGVQGAGSNLKK